jgi:signal transduction histidine kinase/DNA-binding response OmpR family regulator
MPATRAAHADSDTRADHVRSRETVTNAHEMMENDVQILLVEDNPGDAQLVRQWLREAGRLPGELIVADRVAKAREILASTSIDVILLDLGLPDSQGVDTVFQIYLAAPGIPIIVLTGLDDQSVALEALKAGAQDYLIKGRLDGALLARAIRYGIERKRLEADRERLRERLEAEHERLRFLADAGIVLAASLDFEETLASVAKLAVEFLADYCVIDIVEEDGEIRRLQVAHSDPEMAEVADQLLRFPLDRSRPHLVSAALDDHEARVVREITDEVLRSVAQNEEHLQILRKLNPVSYIAVPLLARDRLLGTLLFVSCSHRYSDGEMRLAEELARRAALAVDDARLYRRAQDVIRARDEVLRIVSHDLRNPLSTISMSAEILMDENVNFNEEQKLRQLRIVLRSAERMNRLIGDLLDVSRIEAGQLSLDEAYHSPERLVTEAVDLHQAQATAKALTITSEVQADLPPVLADRDRVLQVLANLIGNSIKFTPEGGAITVSAEPSGDAVLFAVRDTGPGIPPDQLANLFRPFWQGRRGGRDGAGLGLAVSKGIVEAHGGTIAAESEVGVGTKIFFTLKPGSERRGVAGDGVVSGASAIV